MRIDHSLMLTLDSYRNSEPQRQHQAPPDREQAAAADAYSHHAGSAAVIDAEYVDISPAARSAQSDSTQRRQLETALMHKTDDLPPATNSVAPRNKRTGYYQALAADIPAPGSVLSIFA